MQPKLNKFGMKDIDRYNKEKGIITIEASLSFMIFMFLIMFIYCFSNIYIAQNIMNHAVIQATQTIALESYGREKIGNTTAITTANTVVSEIEDIANTLFKNSGAFEISLLDSVTEIDSTNQLKNIVKKAMTEALVNVSSGNDYEENAVNKLKSVGIDDAWNDIDFSGTKLTKEEIIITVTYDVRLKYPFFGKEKVTITKSAKSKLFKDSTRELEIS